MRGRTLVPLIVAGAMVTVLVAIAEPLTPASRPTPDPRSATSEPPGEGFAIADRFGYTVTTLVPAPVGVGDTPEPLTHVVSRDWSGTVRGERTLQAREHVAGCSRCTSPVIQVGESTVFRLAGADLVPLVGETGKEPLQVPGGTVGQAILTDARGGGWLAVAGDAGAGSPVELIRLDAVDSPASVVRLPLSAYQVTSAGLDAVNDGFAVLTTGSVMDPGRRRLLLVRRSAVVADVLVDGVALQDRGVVCISDTARRAAAVYPTRGGMTVAVVIPGADPVVRTLPDVASATACAVTDGGMTLAVATSEQVRAETVARPGTLRRLVGADLIDGGDTLIPDTDSGHLCASGRWLSWSDGGARLIDVDRTTPWIDRGVVMGGCFGNDEPWVFTDSGNVRRFRAEQGMS